MANKILHLDMDNTLVDFQSGIDRTPTEILDAHPKNKDEIPGIFCRMDPIPHAVDSYHRLRELFDVYILTTAPWKNPSAWSDKLMWVKRHLGEERIKHLTISHNKHLVLGDFLVDDRPNNGAEKFTGEWIRFGSKDFPDWPSVVAYLEARA